MGVHTKKMIAGHDVSAAAPLLTCGLLVSLVVYGAQSQRRLRLALLKFERLPRRERQRQVRRVVSLVPRVSWRVDLY